MAREENQRKAEQGSVQRAKDAAENQRRAAGLPPNEPGLPRDYGLRNDGPVKVSIVDGQQSFFDELRRALGIATGSGSSTGSGGRGDDFQALLDSNKAITEAAKQISQDVKTFTTMSRDIMVTNGRQIQSMGALLSQMRQHDQAQMSQLFNFLSSGGGHGGGGGDGHGGGGHGGVGFNPNTNQYTSYGGIQSRFRAGAANFIQNTLGTGGLGKHANAAAHQQAARYSHIAGGLASSGIRGGLSRVPLVGTALAAGEGINAGAEWLTSQAAQNAVYQNIYAGDNTSGGGFASGFNALVNGGGSTSDRSGIANRMAEEGYVLSNRFSVGGMDEAASRQAFQGVSSLGYVGQQRDQNLGFISDAYKNLGMGPNESLQYNQLQSSYGQTNLDALYQSLMKVSKAAAATSQSAETLRRSFIGNYQSALQGGAGASAAGLAGAMTMMTSTNRDLSGVGYGAGIMTDPTLQYAGASMIGMTPGQVQGQAAQGNPFPQLASQQALTSSMLNTAVSPNVKSRLNQLIQGKGGAQRVQASGGAQYDIATDLIQHPEWNTEAVRMALMQAGVSGITSDSSSEQIAEAYINYQSGNDFNKQAQSLAQTSSVHNLGTGNVSASIQQQQANLKKQHDSAYNMTARFWDFGPAVDKIVGLFGGDTRTDNEKKADSAQDVMNAYTDLQKRAGNGISDPAIEAAMSRFGNDQDTMIRVQSKDGDKVVSLKDAITYYPDQLSKGSATIASKDPNLNGKRVNDVTGVKDVGLGPTGDTSKTQNFGEDAAQWEKDNPVNGQPSSSGSGNGNGQVTISLSPEAARLFNITGTGVNIDSAAAANVPPAPGGN